MEGMEVSAHLSTHSCLTYTKHVNNRFAPTWIQDTGRDPAVPCSLPTALLFVAGLLSSDAHLLSRERQKARPHHHSGCTKKPGLRWRQRFLPGALHSLIPVTLSRPCTHHVSSI